MSHGAGGGGGGGGGWYKCREPSLMTAEKMRSSGMQ